jgi:hypothetical protein
MFVCAHPSAKAGRGCVSTPYQKLIHKWFGGGGACPLIDTVQSFQDG